MNGVENPPVVEEAICEECHHLFNTSTLEIVKGWERCYFVSTGPKWKDVPDLCGKCKDMVIESLEKGVPVQ